MIRPFKFVAIGIMIFLVFRGVNFLSGVRFFLSGNIEPAYAQQDPNFDANLQENVVQDKTEDQISKPKTKAPNDTSDGDLPIEIEQGNIESGTVEIPISEYKALKTLSKRRKELISIENNIKMRQELISAAQAKLNKKIEEFNASKNERDAIFNEKKKSANEEENIKTVVKNLITSYEAMKAKDAARIFNDMDPSMVYKIIKNMNAKKVSAIMSKMNSKNVETLTRMLLDGNDSANLDTNRLPQIGR